MSELTFVTPSVSNVRRFRLLAVQHRLHTAGVRVLRQRGESRAFAGLRDYAVGDDPWGLYQAIAWEMYALARPGSKPARVGARPLPAPAR